LPAENKDELLGMLKNGGIEHASYIGKVIKRGVGKIILHK